MKKNGHARELADLETKFGKIQTPKPIVLRSALDMANTIRVASWLLRPYLEKDCVVLLFGDLGTFKSFLALLWALSVARLGHHVVYLSAEGHGLGRRIKGWAIDTFGSEDWRESLTRLPFFGIEQPLNLSANAVIETLVAQIEEGAIKPALIVIDTLSKNSDGQAEASNEDASAYLNQIDQKLRSRFDACVLLVHHTGHGEKQRARGPYTFMANTDANFRIERPDPDAMTVTVTAGRMKDCEPPAPFSLAARVVEVDEVDDEGKPVTTLVLEPTDLVAAKAKRPTGKAQRAILTELERRQKAGTETPIWTLDDVREIGKQLDLAKSTTRDAVKALIETGFLQQTIGGMALGYQP